ncbi:hypothetical protein BDZ89DRAFT_245547 [Hymenopellis radicata]|nr:hypothetical protein BDZ89DRAFT_245547 [Hymenopellis radicata]
MVPAGLPETAGTRWKKVEEYIPRPRTPSPPADPPAPDAPVAVPNVPMPMPDVPVPVRDVGLPVRAASRLRKPPHQRP